MSEGIFRALQEEDEGGEILNSDSKEEVAKEDAWTVSTSTKTRRLAPAFTLSRKDLGADSPRNAIAALEMAAAKKKVIRFNRDDILGLRKPSKMLTSMADLDVVSIPVLEPMGYSPLDQEDVLRLWNADKDKNRDAAKAKGRGRGKGEGEEEEGGDDEWSRGRPNRDKGGGGGLWDDVDGDDGMQGMGGGLDLADFAAAALKFRSDTRGLGLADMGLDDGGPRVVEEDEMEKLFREQKDAANNGMGSLEEDDDEPEWADADVNEPIQLPTKATETSHVKRNLLFETLNIKKAEPPVEIVAPIHNNIPVMMPMPMLTVPESWFYRDPQNNVQGPYETASMRQWHEACYFTPELPIKLRHWPVFHPLRAVFPDSETAFSPNTATQEPYQSPPPQMRQGPPGGPPPMGRPLQSEIMDIDSILRQQAEQRQILEQNQRQQQQLQQQTNLERQRLDEQRRQQQAQQQAIAEQQHAAKQAQLAHQQLMQQQMHQQQLAEQEKDKVDRVKQAQYEYERQQQHLQQQALKQQLMLQQQQQQQQHAQHQKQLQDAELLHQKNLQRQQQQLDHQRDHAQQMLLLQQAELLNQKKLQQQQQQGRAPAPAGPAWGSSNNNGPSLAQIQADEAHLRLQHQQQMIQGQQGQQAPRSGSSFQLKSLLGLSSSNSSNSLNGQGSASPWDTPSSAPAAAPPSPSLSMKEIQQIEQVRQHEELLIKQQQAQLLMQQQIRAARENAASEAATASVITSSWSGAADSSSRKGKVAGKAAPSLRDIMQSEEATATAAASQPGSSSEDSPFPRPAPAPAPGSWAAKAATSGAAAIVAKAPAPNGKKATAASVVAPLSAPPAQIPAPKPASSGPSFSGNGGGGATGDLSEWCVAQLTKIRAADSTNNTDPSEFFGVLEYCATLQSAQELRETFSAYLGSTTLVSNFASEFLKRRDGTGSSGQVSAASLVAATNPNGGASKEGTKKKKGKVEG